MKNNICYFFTFIFVNCLFFIPYNAAAFDGTIPDTESIIAGTPLPEICHDLRKDKQEINNAPVGCFNIISLTLVWYPEWCKSSQYQQAGCDTLSKGYAGSNLALHGLWPELSRDIFQYITFCPPPHQLYPQDISIDLWKELKVFFPLSNGNLMDHEWDKHGVCMGISPQQYFAKAMDLAKELTPSKEFSAYIGKKITKAQLDKIFQRDTLPWCSHFSDGKQYLEQITFYYDLKYNPISIPETQKANIPGKFYCDLSKDISIRPVSEYQKLKTHIGEINHRREPINVGFDVDDTLLISDPGFAYGLRKYGPNFYKKEVFWNEMNNGWDEFSLVKNNVKRILKKHLDVKNIVHIITARDHTKTEQLTAYLKKVLEAPNLENVIFTSGAKNKHIYMKEKNIKIYYGDSDSDISEALLVGAKPYRILRTIDDKTKGAYHLGRYGETIIRQTDF